MHLCNASWVKETVSWWLWKGLDSGNETWNMQ